MSKSNNVDIIIVNYKNWIDTVECLESILKLNYKNFRVFVIDNYSQNSSIENIIKWANGKQIFDFTIPKLTRNLVYPLSSKPVNLEYFEENMITENTNFEKINLIKSNENGGFAVGNNLILKKLINRQDFEFAWLLNNDTIIEANSLGYQIEFYLSKTRIGILGSKLLYYHNPNIIQALGGKISPLFAESKHLYNENINSDDIFLIKPDYIIGASMLVHKDFIKDVGLMDEQYFIYYEETDWAFRAIRKNWDIDICQKSKVYHKEGASIGSNSTKKSKSFKSIYYGIRNRLIFNYKFYPILLVPMIVLFPLYLFYKSIKKYFSLKFYFL